MKERRGTKEFGSWKFKVEVVVGDSKDSVLKVKGAPLKRGKDV